MALLKNRSEVLTQENDVNLVNLEKIFNHYDQQFNTLDERRLSQISILPSSATSAQIIDKINEIIVALNNSDITSE